MTTPTAARAGRDTKSEIIAVAMRRFVEDGYEKTSLREIADEIGVTKAALYYHFRTKEDIVTAALDAHSARVGAVIDWLRGSADLPDRNEQLVEKLLALFAGDSGVAMRFGQSNPTAMTAKEFGRQHLGQLLELMTVLAGEHPDAEQMLRATLAFGALVIGTVEPEIPIAVGTLEQRQAAGRKVALELLEPLQPGR